MTKIEFIRRATSGRAHDAAYIDANEDIAEALASAIVESISTDVEIELGNVKVHLAMLLNPDHWADDWREQGVEDVDGFLAGLVA